MVKKVTSFDVARLAGVSQPTVSRALRNLPGTSPQTRERVRSAAEQLDYIPSDAGRVLSLRSTRRIAVVSAELTNPYYPELVEPIRRELARHGYRIVVITEDAADSVGVSSLADGSYDGVLLTTTRRRSTLPRDLTERGVPHVLANRALDYPESSTCTVDNEAGMAAVAGLLAALGHQRIASLQGPVDTSTGRERAEGLARALRDHGIPLRRELTRRVEFSHDAGFAAARELLDCADRPTAVVSGNDVIAIGVLSAARRLGLRVPDDLTVIGFDDIPLAAWPVVGLTTVKCDLDLLGRLAVGQLLEQLAEPAAPPVERRVPTALVLRGTHATAP